MVPVCSNVSFRAIANHASPNFNSSATGACFMCPNLRSHRNCFSNYLDSFPSSFPTFANNLYCHHRSSANNLRCSVTVSNFGFTFPTISRPKFRDSDICGQQLFELYCRHQSPVLLCSVVWDLEFWDLSFNKLTCYIPDSL
ncbi:unnamed protein product [Lactuca saligna]|uniref:Uncharacterized protein n=1 Tax=Lactuca saligna TaxID=75948 RepID=A0AA35ZXI3_LACSI|nr:unnamed protein product [Lactuca saligna]